MCPESWLWFWNSVKSIFHCERCQVHSVMDLWSVHRQHWFISRLDGAAVTAGGFTPQNSNVLVLSTSSNHVYAFDVEAKQLGEWSINHTYSLPTRFQEFPGEVIGLSFPPASSSLSVIVYSPRYSMRRQCNSFFLPGSHPLWGKLLNWVLFWWMLGIQYHSRGNTYVIM